MRILLIANEVKEEAFVSAEEVAGWLSAKRIAHKLVSADTMNYRSGLMDRPFNGEPFDFAVTFGGDGTLLRAAHAVLPHGVPVLGINFGNLGFLTGAEACELYDALEAAIAGDIHHETRATLRCDVVYLDGRTESYDALNELALSRGNSGTVIRFEAWINETRLARFSADGMVVCTATGSTAYALSAGGPVINPSASGLSLVPIAPHSLISRAVVTGPDDVVTIKLHRDSRDISTVFLDGETTGDDAPVDKLVVRNGTHRFELLRYREADFYDDVSRIFFNGGTHA